MGDDNSTIKELSAIKEQYDRAARVIAEMNEDAERLSIKFGTNSELVKTKYFQIEVLKDFYSKTSEYINELRNLSVRMAINHRAMDLICMQKDTGLPWDKVGELLMRNTPDPELWKPVKDADKLLELATKVFLELDGKSKG